ncbi:MAG TPA: hypothetical protein VK961_24540 [Chthoniobacter sp.]|nr:hypothetical protein [Chthoniobacter sp.]
MKTPWGYDGEFYAMIATDPLLLGAELKPALDIPSYRARRIVLPMLAWCAGLGNPHWILQCYAVANLLFWYLLLFGMVYFLKPATLRDYLCIGACCLTSGVLFSIQRALLDLPAATFSFFSAALSGEFAVVAVALAILTKDSYMMSLGVAFRPCSEPKESAGRLLLRLAMPLLPFIAWCSYVYGKWGAASQGQNFSWPMEGYASAFLRGWAAYQERHMLFPFTEMAAPVSLVIQIVYLLVVARSYRSPFWRIGAGFAIASLFLSSEVFGEQMSFCRDTIMVTMAFNIGLMQNKPRWFLAWFVPGNLGLTAGLMHFISGLSHYTGG